MATTTINDLPPELLYTILSHRIGDILFDYLFLAPLVPSDDIHDDTDVVDVEEHTQSLIFNGNSLAHPLTNANANAHAFGEESPNTAVVDEWTSRRTTRVNHHNRAGGKGTTNVDTPLKEISSLGCVSVAWRIVLARILGNILHQDYLPHRDHHQAASLSDYHLTPPSRLTTPPVLSLGNHHVLLRSMQVTLRTLLQESIDNYRMEQESLVVPGHQPGVNTPTGSNTPSQMTIAIPNTNTAPLSIPTTLLPQPTICTLISALTADACPFVQLPIFTEALRYTQASIFTCDDNSKNTASTFGSRTTRNDLSLTLTNARISGALDLLRDPPRTQITRSPIRPKEISETVHSGMDSVSGKLQKALQVCQWNDLLEKVFLRGERTDEVLTDIHACFESMEEQSGSIEMFHLLRSGLFKTVQCISRVGVVSHGYGGGSNGDGDGEAGRLETASEEWKLRAGVLSFCWTGRVIGWNGI